ncbi:hypothetical protein TNCV_3412311 [Trichonephila clavipes]|uniref:Secreted protein n=1 Tax=Trichonephila clavipes TaxID=2585209 RepID=A0A8X6UZR2_TRICX|nr:hypothetical protein TNCV_3412311 [Trichonephila clavipes]
MAATITKSHIVGFIFLWGNLKGLVHRVVVTRFQAACTSLDTTLLERVHSFTPLSDQACFDMHSRCFGYLPL